MSNKIQHNTLIFILDIEKKVFFYRRINTWCEGNKLHAIEVVVDEDETPLITIEWDAQEIIYLTFNHLTSTPHITIWGEQTFNNTLCARYYSITNNLASTTTNTRSYHCDGAVCHFFQKPSVRYANNNTSSVDLNYTL